MKKNSEVKATRRELAEIVSSMTGWSNKEAEQAVKVSVEALRKLLCEQRNVELRGLGTFFIRIREPRDDARNPRTGERISVGRRVGVGFRAGRALRVLLNNDN